MNGRAILGAYLFRLYVCDKEMSWPHHIGETHQPDWVVYVRDSEKFQLTNVIPEQIIFVSRGITVLHWGYTETAKIHKLWISVKNIELLIMHPGGTWKYVEVLCIGNYGSGAGSNIRMKTDHDSFISYHSCKSKKFYIQQS